MSSKFAAIRDKQCICSLIIPQGKAKPEALDQVCAITAPHYSCDKLVFCLQAKEIRLVNHCKLYNVYAAL